jgi:dienelactone hydrolase
MGASAVVLEPFEFINSSGDSMRGDIYRPAGGRRRPLVLIVHSFMSFKDWGFFPYVGRKIAEAGYVSIIFNFSHNGISLDRGKITDFEKFERNTFSKELDDLGDLIYAIEKNRSGSEYVERNTIILLGHSRGGGISIIRAAGDPRVKGLITWSAIAKFDRWTGGQKARWRSEGFLPLSNNTSATPLRVGIGLLNDLDRHAVRLSIVDAAARIRVPWLIVHGKADVTVPEREAEMLFAAADKTAAELFTVDGVGHLYNAASPEDDGYKSIDKIIGYSTHWLQRHFS